MIGKAIVTAAVALTLAGSAQAHYGDKWFQTRANMEDSIVQAYEIESASCRPWEKSHWQRDNEWTLKRYDHFVCGVNSFMTGRVCVVLAHQAGKNWWSIVLTGYHRAKGPSCLPSDLSRK